MPFGPDCNEWMHIITLDTVNFTIDAQKIERKFRLEGIPDSIFSCGAFSELANPTNRQGGPVHLRPGTDCRLQAQ